MILFMRVFLMIYSLQSISTDKLSLSTEWVDYVEEPMEYRALRPHFSLWVGGWRVLGVGGRVGGGGVGDGVGWWLWWVVGGFMWWVGG